MSLSITKNIVIDESITTMVMYGSFTGVSATCLSRLSGCNVNKDLAKSKDLQCGNQ